MRLRRSKHPDQALCVPGDPGPPIDFPDLGRPGRSTTERWGPWSCPVCAAPWPPQETPAGVYCRNCRTKLETCCEGAPLPERKPLPPAPPEDAA